MANAPEALLAALQGYMRQKRPFPIPSTSPPEGAPRASLPELAQAKALLHNAMLAERVSNSELARRMGNPPHPGPPRERPLRRPGRRPARHGPPPVPGGGLRA